MPYFECPHCGFSKEFLLISEAAGFVCQCQKERTEWNNWVKTWSNQERHKEAKGGRRTSMIIIPDNILPKETKDE